MHIFYSATNGLSNTALEQTISIDIPKLLQSYGHSVTTSMYNPSEHMSTPAAETTIENIIAADIFIGEMSQASQTLGFELAFALTNTKPCLYLYSQSRAGRPGNTLTRHPSRLLKIKSYTAESLPAILETFLSYSVTQLNTARTSFMSTRQIDNFLNNESLRLGLSKGELIRNILTKATK